MINPKPKTLMLTQGAGAAERVFALPSTALAGEPTRTSESTGASSPEPSPPLDPEVIAAKVYELLCRELSHEQQRRAL